MSPYHRSHHHVSHAYNSVCLMIAIVIIWYQLITYSSLTTNHCSLPTAHKDPIARKIRLTKRRNEDSSADTVLKVCQLSYDDIKISIFS